MESTAFVAAISALVGALLGAGGICPVIIAIGNHKRQSFLDAQHAMGDLFKQLSERIDYVESAERECIHAKEELLKEMGHLRAELEALRAKIKDA